MTTFDRTTSHSTPVPGGVGLTRGGSGATAPAMIAGLTIEQVEVFADGLYHVATLGGVHDSEVAVVREFLADAGHANYEVQLGRCPFDIERAAASFDTSFVRRLFVKACILMVRADHVVTAEERELLDFIAGALGLAEDLAMLEAEVDGQSLV